MDHDEAIGLMETAAAEPDGLERLMAGDTAEAAALAGHLAACPGCVRELARIQRTSELVREAVRSSPDPELRERTLAYVRALGIRRGAPVARPASRSPRPLAWVASLGVAVAVAVAVTLAVGGLLAPAPDRTVEALARVASASLRIGDAPDARRVDLTSTSGSATAGTLLFSPSTEELVVIATDLEPPPPGTEYRCWVETPEGRLPVGRMFFGGGLAYWVGPVEGLGAVPQDARFGVSVVDPATSDLSAPPVLEGSL